MHENPLNESSRPICKNYKNRTIKSELEALIPPEIKNDELYYLIEKMAAEENIKNVLEIGSSAGGGSTEAFASGLRRNSKRPTLYCMEISWPRFAELRKRYKASSRVKCYHVSSVGLSKFPSEEEVAKFYNSTTSVLNNYPLNRVLGWLRQDKEYLVDNNIPECGIQRIKHENKIDKFDMVLIDGSEFTGKAELDEVYGSKIIILDDINGYKNHENYYRLAKNSSYSLVAENRKLRNGYAVFRRQKRMLPIHFFTIVLNGQPFIRYHVEILKQLPFRWHWHIVEGVADLKHDTSWSVKLGGRITEELHRNGLSNDGTSEYLNQILKEFPENITIYRKPNGVFWDGKIEMINAPIENINEECLLWQIDADELWTLEQLIVARQMFMENITKDAAYYYCHYFVGENLITTTQNTYGNNTAYEWLRTWRFKPGMRWITHEPPALCRKLPSGGWEDISKKTWFTHNETESRKLIFQHYAYATEKQLKFKEIYYGYKSAVKQWKSLKENWQASNFLHDYFEWVNDGTQVGSANSLGLIPLARKNEWGKWSLKNAKQDLKDKILYRYPTNVDPNVITLSSLKVHTKTRVRKSVRSMKNILVVSHERSGTHFLMNTIAKNFPKYSNHELSILGTPDELRQIFESYYLIEETRIFKSHHQFNFFKKFWQDLIKHFHVFYIVRDGRDVLNSCFHYYNKHPNIFPFTCSSIGELFETVPDSNYSLKLAPNVIKRWTNHVESWMCVKDYLTIVKYEDLSHNFADTVKQISKVLEIDIKAQLVKPSLQGDKSIDARKGVVGDWRSYFTSKDLTTFNENAAGCMHYLGYYGRKISNSNKSTRIIWVRTDSIGDNILANSMLFFVKEHFKDAVITVLCQTHIAEIYEACPFVEDIITFDKQRTYKDEEYRSYIIQQLKTKNADIALNSVYSRELLTDIFTIESCARERIGFNGNLCNISAELRDKHAKYYSRLLPSGEEHKPELKRHEDFLSGLGIKTSLLQPIVWTTPEDDKYADRFFKENNLRPEKTIAFFGGAQYDVRLYNKYGEAFIEVIREIDGYTIIAFGTDKERDINQNVLDLLDIPTVNLCGKTTLRQTAVLLKRCCLAVGAETGNAHMACAMGTPNVVLLGGGHFGRFMPYSPLTTIVCLPLECYGCNWNCMYERPHCVKDIRPEMIAQAIRETLERTSKVPRVFIQANFLWNPTHEMPIWKSFEQFLDPKNIEIICFGEDKFVLQADAHDAPSVSYNQNGLMKAMERERITGMAEKLYQTARKFKEGGREKEAIGALEIILTLYPDFVPAHNDLGFLYYKDGDNHNALKHYEQAAKFAPNNAIYQKDLADFNYVTQRQVEKSLEHYARAYSKNPEDIHTLLMLGHISVTKKRFEEASVFYKEVLKIEPFNRDAQEKLEQLASFQTPSTEGNVLTTARLNTFR